MRVNRLEVGILLLVAGCRHPQQLKVASTHPAGRIVAATRLGARPYPVAVTHPAGTIVAATRLGARPYPVAVTPSGRALVGLLDNGKLASSVLPDAMFGDTIAVGSVPTDIALDRTGNVAFVANQFDHEVQALDTKTGASIGSYPVSGSPFSVAAASDGVSIFVTTNADSIFRVSTSSARAFGRPTDGASAQSVVVDGPAKHVYVSTRAAGTILELDAEDLSLVRRFSPGGMTQEAGLVHGRRELWVANEDGFVTIVSLASGKMSNVTVEGQAWGLAVSPDEQQVWVGLLDVGAVAVIDVASRQVVGTIRTGGRPRRIRFTSNGDRAVIANEAGWVNVVQ